MKENSSIDQLFQKAANTPVHTSFDEAKATFSAALTQRQKVRKRRRFNSWILMITIITSTIVAGFLFLGNNNDSNANATNNHSNNTKSTKQSKDKPEASTDDKTLPSMEQLAVLNASESYEFKPMSRADQRRLLKEPELLKFPHLAKSSSSKDRQNFIFSFAEDRREKKDSIQIPTLTEKEISENEKLKRKMIKAVAKQDKDEYAYIPSGSSKYKGQAYAVQAFFMQTNEVTNLQYRTFLNDLLIQGRTEDYQTAYPQEEQWSKHAGEGANAMNKVYFTHPAYNNYPVVNITRKAAEMYCIWLTTETNNSKYVDSETLINDLRLPQRLEWVYAASAGNSKNVYPWGGPSTKNAENCYLANYMPDSSLYLDGAFFTASTRTYIANGFGLFNISGNAAEMVYGTTTIASKTDLMEIKKDPGTAGGGWMDDAEALKIEGDDPYSGITEGHPNIGFRVVMTYLKKP